jgi:hypothetical protein
MMSAGYFRRQANICLRLARISACHELTLRLKSMADDLKVQAEEIERRTDTRLAPVSYERASVDGEGKS